jgi:hypothetical protein
MLAASFPTLRLPAWTCADRSGPAAEPAFGVSTSGFSGEASQPGTRVPAGALLPNPVRTPLRSVVSGPLPQGRHRMFPSRSFALRHGSCLLPLKLRSFVSGGRGRFRSLPLLGSYRVSVVIAGFPAPSSRITQSATVLILFHLPVATPAGFGGFVLFVQNRRMVDHHTGSQ